MRRKIIILIALAVLINLAPASYAADQWPTSPITCIVSFAAGGSADRLARGISPFLEKALGVPFIVENRPGASGQIATQMFLSKPADGNTIMLAVQSALSISIAVQGAKYSINDLEFVNAENFGTQSITVLADSPYQTLDDLIKAIKEKPDTLKLGSLRGGSSQLMTLLLLDKLGLKVRVVNYNSGAPIRTALLGKHIDFSINGAVTDATMLPKVRSLALTTQTKYKDWPNTPFINDVVKKYGVSFPEIGDIRCFAFKKGFRSAYPERWNKFIAAYKGILESDEYKAYTKKIGTASETEFRGPEKSTKLVLDQHELFVKYKDKFKK